MKDKHYDKAVKLITEYGNVSTSYLQREMRIGYNRAARLIEQMEKEGIVTPLDALGKRSLVEGISGDIISAVSLANYLSITRAAGLPDTVAEETYKDNKESADKLTEFKLKHDIKKGDLAKSLIGHNSGETPHSSVTKAAIRGESKDVGGVAGQRLSSFVERVERLEEEKAALMEDIKEVYAEAKGVGFDVKQIRKLITLRKMDTEKRHEEEAILDLYKSAIGMV